jgi:hypothetical protein
MESDYTASSGLEVKRLDARPALVASPRGAQLHGDPAARPPVAPAKSVTAPARCRAVVMFAECGGES